MISYELIDIHISYWPSKAWTIGVKKGIKIMPFESIDEIKKALPGIRAKFEMEVEAAALEVTHIAKDISSAIGEISITEAKQAIIREFIKRLE